MHIRRLFTLGFAGISVLSLAACSGDSPNRGADEPVGADAALANDNKIWGLFSGNDDPNVTVEVNRYLWNASLDVLSFMPVEAADPFSGILVFGYGTPPGSGRAYKATVNVRDPALDARSLSVALYTRNGPASAEAVHAIEDAILTRARQLRVADGRL